MKILSSGGIIKLIELARLQIVKFSQRICMWPLSFLQQIYTGRIFAGASFSTRGNSTEPISWSSAGIWRARRSSRLCIRAAKITASHYSNRCLNLQMKKNSQTWSSVCAAAAIIPIWRIPPFTAVLLKKLPEWMSETWPILIPSKDLGRFGNLTVICFMR